MLLIAIVSLIAGLSFALAAWERGYDSLRFWSKADTKRCEAAADQ